MGVLGRDHVISEMCDAIQRLSSKYEEAGKLLGVGIGIPGIIDMQTGMLRKSANLPGWEEYPVQVTCMIADGGFAPTG